MIERIVIYILQLMCDRFSLRFQLHTDRTGSSPGDPPIVQQHRKCMEVAMLLSMEGWTDGKTGGETDDKHISVCYINKKIDRQTAFADMALRGLSRRASPSQTCRFSTQPSMARAALTSEGIHMHNKLHSPPITLTNIQGWRYACFGPSSSAMGNM